MIYKNVEIHNIAELIDNGDGSVSWKRVPSAVGRAMESPMAERIVRNATGVELRFVIRSGSAVIRMCTAENDPQSFATFHVYRGGIQGGWEDHEVHRHVTGEIQAFEIRRSDNLSHLRVMAERMGSPWDPEVVRVIFDRGRYRLHDVLGDVVPPAREQCPRKTLLAYGSSITHGSNAIDQSHAWVSLLAQRLRMDARNLGMAGSCALEPAMAEYIAAQGEQGKWDAATLELGINVLNWEEEKIRSRVENILRQVVGRNPHKPVFVISPFYHCGEAFSPGGETEKWRSIIAECVSALHYSNATYINGPDVLGDMSLISADEVHPNICGVERIADVLTEKIRRVIGG